MRPVTLQFHAFLPTLALLLKPLFPEAQIVFAKLLSTAGLRYHARASNAGAGQP